MKLARSILEAQLVVLCLAAATTGCGLDMEENTAGAESQTANLQYGRTSPENGAKNVERRLRRVTVHYNDPLDCNNPIRGMSAFRVYSQKLFRGKRQEIYDQMAPWGGGPQLVCDPVHNYIYLDLPGPLLGGAEFVVETRARGLDGSELPVRTFFETERPGLTVEVVSVDNEITRCDTRNPFSNSENCDVYMITQTKRDRMDATQENRSLPPGGGGNWNDWTKGQQIPLQPPVLLYSDEAPVGDTFQLKLHAFDADSGDGLNRALKAIKGVGKVASVVWAPAAVIGEGAGILAEALPPNGDDPIGAALFAFGSDQQWGADREPFNPSATRALRINRNHHEQIVVNVRIEENPRSWFWQVIE